MKKSDLFKITPEIVELKPLDVEVRMAAVEGKEASSYGYWVRIVPPDYSVEEERQQFVRMAWDENGNISASGTDVGSVRNYEMVSTYGGSNIEVEILSRDEDGKLILSDDGEPTYELLKFSESGSESRDELREMIGKLPVVLVKRWREAIKAVVPAWRFPW